MNETVKYYILVVDDDDMARKAVINTLTIPNTISFKDVELALLRYICSIT